MSEFLSIDSIAELLDVHRDTIRKAIAERKLKAYRVGVQYRVRRTDFDAWLGKPVN
ncbi:hypothetical protein CH293_20275 [Rhodococcus sp. 14-2470-1b]|uniref:helix-turn-helix domain-containing protein n=1 Tax=Rhodococcus sp. 14-2470-1b TaxID=2023149 RepID=UPI000B9B69EF|nr:helix-turn-helix domain-containing protein [Rhodococcus sp. 14-2470-1b]OZF46384.1 hypothetical protein CH293_20275 [Rhodococcus sp. 14-2470-1b]